MNIPHSMSGRQLATKLSKLGYSLTRQKGSHMRLTTKLDGEHHVTIPDHQALKYGTLRGILKDVAEHHGLTIVQLLEFLES